MNIEESEKEIEKIKEMFMHLKNYGWINDIKKEIDIDKVIEAIETLLTAYEKEKEKNKELENELEKHIKFCEQEAEGSLNNEICHISLNFNKKLLNILNGEE